MSIKADDSPEAQPIGHCHAKLIDREPIRATFYRDMEEPTNDTSGLAFEVFDRWGCLKAELQAHPVKKGTGVWGTELDQGKLLFIEDLAVDDRYRRKGYGRRLVKLVWEQAQGMAPDCDFAIVQATYLNTRDVEAKGKSLLNDEAEAFYNDLQVSAEDFYRAVGFRRIGSSFYFALSKDPSHPSRSLSAADDYRRPLALRSASTADDQVYPYDNDIIQADDSETTKLLETRLVDHSFTEPAWLSVDRHGNNILHMVAPGGKPESLAWILGKSFAAELQLSRNLKGETPLESLEDSLESVRTMRQVGLLTIPIADRFTGFAPNDVKCLQLLKGLGPLTPCRAAQLAYGCTCFQCICGFISPRVSFALECQADLNHDMLSD